MTACLYSVSQPIKSRSDAARADPPSRAVHYQQAVFLDHAAVISGRLTKTREWVKLYCTPRTANRCEKEHLVANRSLESQRIHGVGERQRHHDRSLARFRLQVSFPYHLSTAFCLLALYYMYHQYSPNTINVKASWSSGTIPALGITTQGCRRSRGTYQLVGRFNTSANQNCSSNPGEARVILFFWTF